MVLFSLVLAISTLCGGSSLRTPKSKSGSNSPFSWLLNTLNTGQQSRPVTPVYKTDKEPILTLEHAPTGSKVTLIGNASLLEMFPANTVTHFL